MASPHVAAIAALLIATKRLGAHPSPREVEAQHRGDGAADRTGRTATARAWWTPRLRWLPRSSG